MICNVEYNLKADSKLYLVSGGNKYDLRIYSDATVAQTFSENSYTNKNLHELNNLHEGATIALANPATFSFTVPVFDYTSVHPLIPLATTYTNGSVSSMDFYFELDTITYKLTTAVIETIVFNLGTNTVFTMTISGSATRLSEYVGVIPGTPVTMTYETYVGNQLISFEIDSTAITNVTSMNLEIANEVDWPQYATINNTVDGNISYPLNYVINSRRVSGSITEYLTSNSPVLSDYSTDALIDITIGSNEVADLLGLTLPSAVFTRRLGYGDIITRTYDFRLNTNTSNVVPTYKGV